MSVIFYGNESCTKVVELKKTILNKVKVKEKHEENKIINVDLKNRRVNILIEGEELFIKFITIPKVKKRHIDSIVRNEVLLRYGEDVMFNYNILEVQEKMYKIALYCFHEDKYNLLRDNRIIYSKKLTVEFLQNYIIKYYAKNIKEEKYKMIFSHKNYMYFIKINEGKLVFNKVMELKNKEKIDGLINEFIKDKKVTYYFNVPNISEKENVRELTPITMDEVIKLVVSR